MDIYHVITRGKKFALLKVGNKKPTRIYDNGFEMSQALGFYLLNRNCEIIVHNTDATVRIVIRTGWKHFDEKSHV